MLIEFNNVAHTTEQSSASTVHSNNTNSLSTATSPEIPLVTTAEQTHTVEPSVVTTTTIPEIALSLGDRTQAPIDSPIRSYRTLTHHTSAIRKTLARKQKLASLYKSIANILQEEADELKKKALGI